MGLSSRNASVDINEGEVNPSFDTSISMNNLNHFIERSSRPGTKNYQKEPKNIVDNDHLSLIVNAALMLDQGLVFNSVDGASVIE